MMTKYPENKPAAPMPAIVRYVDSVLSLPHYQSWEMQTNPKYQSQGARRNTTDKPSQFENKKRREEDPFWIEEAIKLAKL